MLHRGAATLILWTVSSVAWAGGGQPVCAPHSIRVDVPGNQVIEVDETVSLIPYWMLVSPYGGAPPAGLSNFAGPAGGIYTIVDGSGGYVLSQMFQPTPCGNCYQVLVSATTRPVQHWDATVAETLLNPLGVCGQHTWTLHIGNTFGDVPASSPFYRFVETIVHKGVTGGCSATGYCPTAPVTRAQMAVFVLLAKEGVGYTPPACTTPMFADVPKSSPFCRWVEELARRGVVSGCGGANYCPESAATRDAMAVFVLRTLDPALNPAPCTAPMFADVPASSPFCPWIEELARRNVVSGCGGGNYCPAAAVTREQMSVFLAVAFNLTL